MSSQRGLRGTPGVSGVSFIYKLQRVRARVEPCGTSACISRGVDSSPSTGTMDVLLDRKELIGLTVLAESRNSKSLYNNPGCQVLSKDF
jgi:hypothetical protein